MGKEKDIRECGMGVWRRFGCVVMIYIVESLGFGFGLNIYVVVYCCVIFIKLVNVFSFILVII